MQDQQSKKTLHLVQQAQRGDRGALDQVFGRYYERALRIVRRRVGERLRRDLESRDILHESLAVAVRKFPEFEMRDDASLLRWLRAIVENQIRDKVTWQNAQRRRHEREVDAAATPNGEAVETDQEGEPPAELVARRERTRLVESYLAKLDPRYRELILARDFEGLDWVRIATRTGRPSAAAARMMYNKALLELGRLIRCRE